MRSCLPIRRRPTSAIRSGHWEGDTLVIDTIGLNDKTRIDEEGITHSDQLHMVEHIRKIEGGKALEPHHHYRPGDVHEALDREAHLPRAPRCAPDGICLRREQP